MAPVVERIPEIPISELGEGPHWDIDTQSLYLTDIVNNKIQKFNPSTGQYTFAILDKQVSIVIPVRGKRDQYVITLDNEVAIITWDGRSEKVSKVETIAKVDEGKNNRINDAKCDPKGRLFFGTMNDDKDTVKPKEGSLFSLSNGKVTTHAGEIGISNGWAWNTKLKLAYYNDSFAGSVDAFDYDIEKGTITNRRPIFTLSKHNLNGLLDGMTIDVDGNIWTAVFNSSKVIKIDPRKPETLLQTIEFPAKQITSVAWGGIDLDVLYVTSGSLTAQGFVEPGEELLPPNGGTFRVTGLGTRGLPADNFVL